MKEEHGDTYSDGNDTLPSDTSNLLLVKANGGFGKTLRVKEYIELHKMQAFWISLDVTCNQKELFYTRLLQQFQRRIPCYKAESLYDIDAGFSIWNNKSAEEKVQMIFDILWTIREPNTAIVFDNIEVLKTRECLTFLEVITRQFVHMKFFFIGRVTPDFLIPCILEGRCHVIEEKKLYLKKEDVLKLVNKYLDYQYEKAVKVTSMLIYYFHGWPAGIIEIIQYLKENEIPADRINWERVISQSQITQYTQYKIFDGIPSEDFETLKIISMFFEYEEELCNLVLQQDSSSILLEKLADKYFFLKHEKDSFHFIPAFQIILKQLISKEDSTQIIFMITEFYIMKKQYEKATAYIVSTNNTQLIEKYFLKYYQQLHQAGEDSLVMNCIPYFIRNGIILKNPIMRAFAELYNGEFDERKQMKGRNEAYIFPTERDFYMTLLSYNDNPIQYRMPLLEYISELKRRRICKKKVRVSSFGQFHVQIIAAGKELSWRTKKGCELFAFLHHMQGIPIKRQVLLDVLWPDGITKNAVTMLHNMIYHIRKELAPYGMEDIIQYKDKMYSINMEWIDSDLELRKEVCEHTEESLYLVQHEELFLKYCGQYLENIDGHWTVELKEFYDKKFMDCCKCIADDYVKKGEYEKALVFLRNILEVDNLREDAMGKVLFCYGKLGDRKAVKMEYKRFVELIRKELNVEPCENLKEMYQWAMCVL